MILRILAVLAVLCFATGANAQNNWSSPGSACVPTDDTIGYHYVDTANIKHAAAATGTIAFNCQVARFNSGTGEWNLKMTYRDSTGTNTTANVRARVYSMAIGTATPVLLAEVDSDASNIKSTTTLASANFNHTFDFETTIYWVQILLKRANTSQVVVLAAVYLDGTSI